MQLTNIKIKGNFNKLLAILGSLASIAGLLAQLGFAPFLKPLATLIPIPIWLFLTLLAISPWILSVSSRHASSALADRLETTLIELQTLKEKITGLNNIEQELIDTRAQLQSTKSKLVLYEALEAEIKGLLSDGGDHSLDYIVSNSSVRKNSDATQQVLRAISALGSCVEGTGGVFPKYRIKKNNL